MPDAETVLAILRQFIEPDDHVTMLDHEGDDDQRTVFCVIDEAAWLTRAEAILLRQAFRLNSPFKPHPTWIDGSELP